MLDGLFIVSLINSCVQLFKESSEKVIPEKNWSNKEEYYKDFMNGVSIEQRMENLENGKYKLKEKYPEPHRDSDGKIIIENSQLYYDDIKNHGAYQAQKWVQQGKYNLTPEELKKEYARIKAKYEYLYSL